MERMSNTSIFNSILSLSSALIRNVKNIDLNFSRDLEAATAHASSRLDQRHGSPTPVSATNSSQPGPSATPSGPIPGPIAFATSPFFIGVLLVSFAVNRIQHIVVAPGGRRHRRAAQVPPRAGQFADGDLFVVDDRVVGDVDAPQRGTWHTFVRDMLVNLRDRCLPLDPNSPFPRLVINFPAVYLLGRAAVLLLCIIVQELELWPTYDSLRPLGEWSEQYDMASICWNVFLAVSIGLVSSSLCQGLMNDINHDALPFNLPAYAFLLHIYSAPLSHSKRDEDSALPSRPPRDALITMFIPLLQLTLLQLAALRKETSTKRLIPTSICGILSLTHFYSVMWRSPLSYPPLNFVSCVLASGLIFISATTCALSALTQILTEGSITKPLLGHNQVLPRLEDDWEIALLRLGTASLQASHVTGLGHEVAGLSAGRLSLSADRVATMQSPRGRRSGWHNEIGQIYPQAQRPHPERHALWVEAKTFGRLLWAAIRALPQNILYLLTDRRPPGQRGTGARSSTPSSGRPAELAHRFRTPNSTQDEGDDELYSRFLRGETMSHEDDGEFDPEGDEDVDSHSDEADSDAERDAVGVLADLSHDGESVGPDVLIAHMSSHGMLTRRQYSQLRNGHDQDDMLAVLRDRRRDAQLTVRQRNEFEDEARRMCVICTIEPRVIVCWPCRCLVMCDDCRANLASRVAASSHFCPCCRQSVEGFSRIWIP